MNMTNYSLTCLCDQVSTVHMVWLTTSSSERVAVIKCVEIHRHMYQYSPYQHENL